ncbi:MAG: DUF4007 family protein [Candidatus Brocadiales bacterium]|nr:DUF4007 family protein [Candidatus Brocadiales bacterium]
MSSHLSLKEDVLGKKCKLTFSGHETFPFRYTWLKKIVDAVSEEPSIFTKETALSDLGVGKNMVYSMRHWGKLTGMIKPVDDTKTQGHFEVTEFANKLLSDGGWDTYLEDIATLWLLHWKISTNLEKATTWYFALNCLAQIEFTKEQLVHELVSFAEANGFRTSVKSIERDVNCFIRTYVASKKAKQSVHEDSIDCPLTELSLIEEFGQHGLYVFSRGQQQDLPDEIFTYALIDYWNEYHKDKGVLSFEDIAYGQGSPGLVFKINEDSLAYRMDSLEKITNGDLRYDETSMLRQVYRVKNVDPEKYIKKYYQ